MKKGFLYITIATMIFVFLSGCTKNKKNDILGTWQQMSFTIENENSPKILWTFNTDNTVIGEVYRNDRLVSTSKANYSVNYTKLKYRLDITRSDTSRFDVNLIDYRGVYAIGELKRDKMAFVRVEGNNDNGEWTTGGDCYIQLEFVKY